MRVYVGNLVHKKNFHNMDVYVSRNFQNIGREAHWTSYKYQNYPKQST